MALLYEGHNVGVVGVGWVNWHKAGHAVDVAADARRRREGRIIILSVGVHDQSSDDAVNVKAVYVLPLYIAENLVTLMSEALAVPPPF